MVPFFLLSACASQPNPQMDSIQRQISALRADIEELYQIRLDTKNLGADVSQLNSKFDENYLEPIRRLEEISRTVLQNVADSKAQMQELADDISAIKENLNEYSQVIMNISDRTKAMESNLVKQIIKLKAKLEGKIPEKVYQTALEFFMNKHYHEAYKTFSSFIDQYPKHNLIEDARLLKGETLYRMGEFEKAITESDRFVSQNPKSTRVAAAIYVKAESLLALKKNSEAKEALLHLVTDYPLSKEAGHAKPLLDSLP